MATKFWSQNVSKKNVKNLSKNVGQKTLVTKLVTKFWSHNFGHKILVTKFWSQTFFESFDTKPFATKMKCLKKIVKKKYRKYLQKKMLQRCMIFGTEKL